MIQVPFHRFILSFENLIRVMDTINMIDWITAEFPCRHEPLNSGCLISIDSNGEQEWNSVKWTSIEGSYSSKVIVRSSGADMFGYATHLRVSGNPAKFLQGHNVFGGSDLSSLSTQFIQTICLLLDIPQNDVDRQLIKAGEYDVSRIDFNQGYALKTRSQVKAWIRAAEFKSRTRSGRPQMKGTTLYWQKSSRRWAIKAYSKGDEIEAKNHTLPDSLKETDIPHFADNLLRIELTLRSLELRERQLYRAKHLTPSTLKKLHAEFIGRIDMNAQLDLSAELITKLRKPIQRTYLLWKDGSDLRSVMSESSFYLHRSELLKYKIDISNPPESITQLNNVVPLIQVLEAEPVQTPDWAYKLGLVAC